MERDGGFGFLLNAVALPEVAGTPAGYPTISSPK
jgi:hypothetical protein